MKRYVNGELTEISEIVAPDGYLFTNGEVFVKSIPKDIEELFTLCQETEQNTVEELNFEE